MTNARHVTTLNVPSTDTHRRANPLKLNLDYPFVTPAVRRGVPSRRCIQYDRQTDRQTLTVVTHPQTSHRVQNARKHRHKHSAALLLCCSVVLLFCCSSTERKRFRDSNVSHFYAPLLFILKILQAFYLRPQKWGYNTSRSAPEVTDADCHRHSKLLVSLICEKFQKP
jgi:hypothetical protein